MNQYYSWFIQDLSYFFTSPTSKFLLLNKHAIKRIFMYQIIQAIQHTIDNHIMKYLSKKSFKYEVTRKIEIEDKDSHLVSKGFDQYL